jgi:hypothetical protein
VEIRPPIDYGAQLLAAEPADGLELRVGRVRLAAGVARVEADHQRRREGPRLRRAVAQVGHLHPALLGDLARDRVLQRLARLDEPGQRAEPPGRPARLAAEQHAVVLRVMDEHDHDRIGARVMDRAAVGAVADVAGLAHRRERAAARAVTMRAVPGEDRGGVGDQPGVLPREPGRGVAQAGTAVVGSDREQGVAIGVEAEQDGFGLGAHRLERRPVAVQPRAFGGDGDRSRGRVVPAVTQPCLVGAPPGGAVEPPAREGVRRRH